MLTKDIGEIIMKKMYSICALASIVFFSDACWGGAFMDALKKIGENSAVKLGDGFLWFDDSKAKDSNQKKRFVDTQNRWECDYKLRSNAEVRFYLFGPTHAPYLQIGSYKILGSCSDGGFWVLDANGRTVRDRSIFQRYTVTEENGGTHVIIKDTGDGFHLDFYWDSNGTVVIKDSSVKSISIHANFVHFLGDNHFEKAAIAAPSGCTFWGSTTTANDLKIYSHSIVKLGGFLGGENYRRPYNKKSLTESELDDFVTTCLDYTKWLSQYVYGSDVGFLNIGGRFETDEVKTEDISFNIDGDTEIKKSLTQSGKNNKTIIRSRGDLAPIALQWLGYFTPDDNRYSVDIEKFIGTKSIKISKQDNIGYSETIKDLGNYVKVFYCNNYISSMYRLCNNYADNKLGYIESALSDFKYDNGNPVDSNDLQVSDYPISVKYNSLDLKLKRQSEEQYQFWFEFNKQPIYFGPEANNRLNALLNFQIFGDYDERFGQGTDQDKVWQWVINPAYRYTDKDGQDEGDSDDDNEVAEPEVVPASSSNNNEGGNSSNTTNGQLEVAPGYIMHPEYMNNIKNKAENQNGKSNMPPEENASPMSQVDFSGEEEADDEDEGEYEN